MITGYLALDPMALLRALPGNVAQGLIWGIMALGVYITFRILDFADLTVDGSLATGGAVAVMLIQSGMHPAVSLVFAFLAGMAAGFVTGFLHTALGIPGILASILTQISLYSVNLGIMGKANQSIGLTQRNLVASSRYVTADDSVFFFVKLVAGCLILGGDRGYSATGLLHRRGTAGEFHQGGRRAFSVAPGAQQGRAQP